MARRRGGDDTCKERCIVMVSAWRHGGHGVSDRMRRGEQTIETETD